MALPIYLQIPPLTFDKFSKNKRLLPGVYELFPPLVVGLSDTSYFGLGGQRSFPLLNSWRVMSKATKFGVLITSGMYFMKM